MAPKSAFGGSGGDGKTVRNGAGAPSAGLGVDGDFYIDTTADAIYGPKTAGAWGSATSLIGPQGEQGPAGLSDWTDLGNLGSTETITGTTSSLVRRIGTLDQACAVTISTSSNQQIDFIAVQDGTGGRAVTFSGVTVWVTTTGTAPDTSARAASIMDRFRFENVGGVCYGYWLTEQVGGSTRRRKTGNYYPVEGQDATTLVTTLNRVVYGRFPIDNQVTVTKIGIGCSATAASSTVRLGIYADDGSGQPGAMVLDAGTVDTATATGDLEITISQTLQAGTYWLASVAQGGTPTVRAWTRGVDATYIGDTSIATATTQEPNTFFQSGVSGALPSSATPSVRNNAIPRVVVKI